MRNPLGVAAVICCVVCVSSGAELSITLDRTLSGAPVSGSPARITVTTNNTHLRVAFDAPYYDGGANSVHLFLANSDHRITELKFTADPAGMVVNMYWAAHNVLRSCPAHSTVGVSQGVRWTGSAEIHSDFLPPYISLYNAASVHPASAVAGSPLQFDSLYAITNYGIALPDLMVLNRYTPIGRRNLFDNDEGYSDEWKATANCKRV